MLRSHAPHARGSVQMLLCVEAHVDNVVVPEPARLWERLQREDLSRAKGREASSLPEHLAHRGCHA